MPQPETPTLPEARRLLSLLDAPIDRLGRPLSNDELIRVLELADPQDPQSSGRDADGDQNLGGGSGASEHGSRPLDPRGEWCVPAKPADFKPGDIVYEAGHEGDPLVVLAEAAITPGMIMVRQLFEANAEALMLWPDFLFPLEPSRRSLMAEKLRYFVGDEQCEINTLTLDNPVVVLDGPPHPSGMVLVKSLRHGDTGGFYVKPGEFLPWPVNRLPLPDEAEDDHSVASCRVCGCTDHDCRQCIERTGQPCHWVEADLCSACAESAQAAAPVVRCAVSSCLAPLTPDNARSLVLRTPWDTNETIRVCDRCHANAGLRAALATIGTKVTV